METDGDVAFAWIDFYVGDWIPSCVPSSHDGYYHWKYCSDYSHYSHYYCYYYSHCYHYCLSDSH